MVALFVSSIQAINTGKNHRIHLLFNIEQTVKSFHILR